MVCSELKVMLGRWSMALGPCQQNLQERLVRNLFSRQTFSYLNRNVVKYGIFKGWKFSIVKLTSFSLLVRTGKSANRSSFLPSRIYERKCPPSPHSCQHGHFWSPGLITSRPTTMVVFLLVEVSELPTLVQDSGILHSMIYRCDCTCTRLSSVKSIQRLCCTYSPAPLSL